MNVTSILNLCGNAEIPLTANARLILGVLDKLSKGHDLCFAGNASIGRFARCCDRTVRNSLNWLRDAGLIEVQINYRLRTRRQIVLLWKRRENASVTANITAHGEIPPHPPIEDPEGNTGKEGGGEEVNSSSTCAPPDPPEPSPPPPVSVQSLPERKPETASEPARAAVYATKDQVEAVVALAKEVFPAQPRQWVLGLARQWRLSWTRAALIRAKKRGQVGTGYVINTLRGFAAEGGPPAELADPEAEARRKAERSDEVCRRMEEALLASLPEHERALYGPSKIKVTGFDFLRRTQ